MVSIVSEGLGVSGRRRSAARAVWVDSIESVLMSSPEKRSAERTTMPKDKREKNPVHTTPTGPKVYTPPPPKSNASGAPPEPEPKLGNASGAPVDVCPVGKSDRRIGILDPNTWEAVLKANVESWKRKGGYQVDGKTPPKGTELFNFWSVDQTARIDYPEAVGEEGAEHVFGTRDLDAEVEFLRFPYLRRTEVQKRPSFIVFEVTGHVMFGIYFGNLQRPQLHLLNPWPLHLGKIQLIDAYDVISKSSEKLSFKIAIVDVAGELEKIKKVSYNLQENERVGFCTLWVGIFAAKTIGIVGGLTDAEKGAASVSGSGVLTESAANLYNEIYSSLQTTLNALVAANMKESPLLGLQGATANAVADLAQSALSSGGKRIRRRRTFRKKSSWKHRNQPLSLVRRRTRRSTRSGGRAT